MVADAHRIAARHAPSIGNRYEHGADLGRGAATEDTIVPFAQQEAIRATASQGFVIGIRFAGDANRAAGDHICGVGIHTAVKHEDGAFASILEDSLVLRVTREDILAYPLGATDRPAGHNDVVVAGNEVDRQAGKGTEDTAIDLGELGHVTLEARIEAATEEELPPEGEEEPHEGGVVETDLGGDARRRR